MNAEEKTRKLYYDGQIIVLKDKTDSELIMYALAVLLLEVQRDNNIPLRALVAVLEERSRIS